MPSKSLSKIELESTGLTDAELDQLWHDWAPYRGITDEELVANALSGDDPEAARSLLLWVHMDLRDGDPMQPAVREYALRAFDRFFRDRIPLGEAFGIERRKRGAMPTRLGARQAIISLISFLNEHRDFPLSTEGSHRPSAFLVAATLMHRRWKISRSPTTLRDEYWNKRYKGKKT